MAEVLLKVGDGSGYQDGDVLCAFSNLRIRCVHAQHLCRLPRHKGHRDPAHLARGLLEATSEYRFERISKYEIRRTTIPTGESEIFGKEKIDVPLFVRRRLQHEGHAIFGAEGSEIWYGGRTTFDHDRMDVIWQQIEQQTGVQETDYQLWPMGTRDIRDFLAVRTVDFTEEERVALESPRYETDDDGNPIVDEDGNKVVLAKRNICVNWSELLDDIKATANQVRDRSIPVGRDIVLSFGTLRAESKQQPQQSDRSKLHSKSRGGRLSNG